ncbi:MAG TPA: hypothetical protein VGY57_06565 [Vicinamibacterales bacterium]|jgi:hypothetical protein|nr:hypothetical protein [Vicinamibacterales bacterium]
MNRIHCLLAVSTGLFALTAACSASKPAAPAPASSSQPAPRAELWGDLKPIVSVKELMRDMLDPASDFIFDSVSSVSTKKGTVETYPRTDKDWEKIRIGAVTIAEGVYLLKIQRPLAPPGDNNNSGGPEPLEASPAEIKAKLEHDPVLWNAKIEALRNVGLQVMEIVKKKDVNELWDAAENLDEACENCHLEYWYPGQKALLMKADKQLRDLYGGERGKRLGMAPK